MKINISLFIHTFCFRFKFFFYQRSRPLFKNVLKQCSVNMSNNQFSIERFDRSRIITFSKDYISMRSHQRDIKFLKLPTVYGRNIDWNFFFKAQVLLVSALLILYAIKTIRQEQRKKLLLSILADPKHIDAYLFDFDDTLVDSDYRLIKIMMKWGKNDVAPSLRKLSFKTIMTGVGLWSHSMTFYERCAYFYGRYKEEIEEVTGISSIAEFEKTMKEKVVSLYRNEVTFFPHSKEVCHLLKEKNPTSRFVIVSNRSIDCINVVPRNQFDFKNFFDLILGLESFGGKPKPDPYPYLKASKEVNVCPNRCVVFEDTRQGVRSGKRAGCYVVGVLNGFNKRKKLKEADLIISLKELRDHLVKNCEY